ncbi:cytochrome c oxidase assembly protein COX18, mitochondrial-like [Ciona intestinalis]
MFCSRLPCKQSLGLINKWSHHLPCGSVISGSKNGVKVKVFPAQIRCVSSNFSEDYGKYSEPGTYESFIGWFTDSSIIQSVELYLTSVHDVTHLPWWLSITLSTFLLRWIIMTPMTIYQMKNMIKYQSFIPVLEKLQNKLKLDVENAAEKKKWDDATMALNYKVNLNHYKRKMMKDNEIPGVLKRYGLPFVQIPLWVSMSVAMRHLTLNLQFTPPSDQLLIVASQLSTEGCLWFVDLCSVDPHVILPFLLCAVNLSIIEIHRGGRNELIGLNKAFVYFMRTIAVILLPVASQMPAGVVMYWLSSSVYGALQALVLKSHRFKKLVRIPISQNDRKTPYMDIFNRIIGTKQNKIS